MKIAIDGPAGSGKSTVAKLLSKHLGIVYVDTGAMYRAIGLYCSKKEIDLDNEQQIEEQLPCININLTFENGSQRIYLNGSDVTDAVRTQEAGAAASKVAKHKSVRTNAGKLQAVFTKSDCIMDGRDIGTVIMPFADIKIFLTATPDERASRRCNELREKHQPYDYEKIKQEIIDRDNEDTTRENSPLLKADDAIELDTTGLTIPEVTSKILSLCEKDESNSFRQI